MRYAPILLILAAGGLFGWFAPDLSRNAPSPAAEAPAAYPTEQVAVLERTAWNDGELVLLREPDGHFYADVSVGGTTARMLVDTGASVIALTAEDANRLGIGWSDADVHPVARGANGPVRGVRTTLKNVQLGTFEIRDVEAVVIPEGLGVSLLGQSFLSQVGRIEMEQDRMTLGG